MIRVVSFATFRANKVGHTKSSTILSLITTDKPPFWPRPTKSYFSLPNQTYIAHTHTCTHSHYKDKCEGEGIRKLLKFVAQKCRKNALERCSVIRFCNCSQFSHFPQFSQFQRVRKIHQIRQIFMENLLFVNSQNFNMQEVLLYLSAFFMVFLSCAVVCFCLRLSLWIYMEYWRPRGAAGRRNMFSYLRADQCDRQGNIFTIHNDTTSSMIANRYTDIFYIEPNNGEGARIPSQQEKDDKELPTYEEVMRMTNQTVSAALLSNATGSVMAASSASVNTTDTTLTVPPYSEIDPNANMIAPPVTVVPSTSHPTALNEVSSCTSPTTTSTATTVTPSLSTNTQIHTSSV